MFTGFMPLFVTCLAMSVGASDPHTAAIGWNSNDGTGCVTNTTVFAKLSADFYTLSVYLNASDASAGPNIPTGYNAKACAVNVGIAYGNGFEFSVTDVTIHAHAALDSGTKATHAITYAHSNGQKYKSTSSFSGPFQGDYAYHITPPSEHRIWSPCGSFSILSLELDLSVSASGNAAGAITDDSFEEAIEYQFGLQWILCV